MAVFQRLRNVSLSRRDEETPHHNTYLSLGHIAFEGDIDGNSSTLLLLNRSVHGGGLLGLRRRGVLAVLLRNLLLGGLLGSLLRSALGRRRLGRSLSLGLLKEKRSVALKID